MAYRCFSDAFSSVANALEQPIAPDILKSGCSFFTKKNVVIQKEKQVPPRESFSVFPLIPPLDV